MTSRVSMRCTVIAVALLTRAEHASRVINLRFSRCRAQSAPGMPGSGRWKGRRSWRDAEREMAATAGAGLARGTDAW